MWPLFLILHLIGLVGYSLVLRKSLVAKIDKWTLATVMQTAIALPMVGVLLIAPPDLAIPPVAWLQVVVTALLVIVFHYTQVQALHEVEAGIFSILFNFRIIISTLLGILFLNEKIVPLQIAGGMFIFLAVLTLRTKGRKGITTRGIMLGLATGVIISILNMSEKKLIGDIGYLNYAVPVMLIAASIMWIITMFRGNRINLKYLAEKDTIYLMVLRTLSAYGFTLAFYAGAVLSVASYVSSLSVVIIVLLAAWLLNEHGHMKQKLRATALAVFGLTLILAANLSK